MKQKHTKYTQINTNKSPIISKDSTDSLSTRHFDVCNSSIQWYLTAISANYTTPLTELYLSPASKMHIIQHLCTDSSIYGM